MGTLKKLGKLIATVIAPVAALHAQSVHAQNTEAQSISNTAAASWSRNGHDFTTQSNNVSFEVVRKPITIDTYVPKTGGGTTLAFNASICGGNPINIPGGFGPGGSVASLERTTTLRIGDVLFFRIAAPTANTDAAIIDTLTAVLTTRSGDREVLQVYETAANSGIFVGAIPTSAIPPQPVQGDCRLSVAEGDDISIEATQVGKVGVIATAQINVLADPFGLVFDSEDGTPVNGARVSLVNAATGAAAQVFADDGVTPWPSTMITGQSVTDGAGHVYTLLPGEYRFPLAALGQYRVVVEPPAPYSAPSKLTIPQLSTLTRPDGGPLTLNSSSFGQAFGLTSPAPIRVDIPVDRPAVAVSLTKVASRATALPGDLVVYTVTVRNTDAAHAKRGVVVKDTPSPLLRLQLGSIRINGVTAPVSAVQIAPDGRQLTVNLGDIAAGATKTITYAMTVRADAAAGQAQNRVEAVDARGLSNAAGAVIRIERDDLAQRMTLIGRVAEGGCTAAGAGRGIPGVRVVLEDGSFAITDAEGRYHFEGLVPGTHVAQVQPSTLPQGGRFVDCARSTASAGSATSRFVRGQGGSLVVADFAAILPEGALPKLQAATTAPVTKDTANGAAPAKDASQDAAEAARVAAERKAAGADTDWLAIGDGPTDFLFPSVDHNPRAPAVRVVIRHRVDEKIELSIDGRPVDPLAFDGARPAPGGTYAVSIWRGIQLVGEVTRLSAVVRDAKGNVTNTLKRDVHFADTAARVELVPEKTHLIADGTTRPVLALRILDRFGRPVHAGMSGEFTMSSPYESAEAVDDLQQRALSGLNRATPRWFVKGDDGIALVELAPTMVSGKLHLEFNFADGQQRRRQELDSWIVPGDQPWTLVGLAEGSVGARSIADNMQRTGQFDSDLGDHARVAFYAKGRVLGKFLLTAAYDSAKQRDDQRLMGVIDPRAYYTVFADGSNRRFDAASREKLYVRIESRAFYALFGDFDTGFDQTQLARYQRSATGIKAEMNLGGLHAQGFGARITSTHRRDEIQGAGITGPYNLSSRAIIANSEQVVLETRDRFRSEVIVSRRTLTRFVDYNIDLLAGTITFSEPVLSRDEALNPQFIVIDYELDDNARGGAVNAGLRTDYTTGNGKLRIGATAVTDTGLNPSTGARTNLVAVDAKARLGENTELRAEMGMSFNGGNRADAWLVEAEHHDGQLDLLAYARSAESDYGLGQLNGAEQGRRKYGLDGRYQISEAFSLSASAWYDDSLVDASHRTAVQLGGLYRSLNTDARLGIATMRDHLADGSSANSTVLEGGVTQRFLDNRLELSASSSIALDQAESVDLPERHRFTARYSLGSKAKLIGTYEIAKGENINARTARGGLELSPWNGSRITTALGQQDVGEYGKRSFASLGMGQSISLNKALTFDATIDSSKTLGAFNPARLVNAAQPASSGGTLNGSSSLTEDFVAVTLGATLRKGNWNSALRGEWRNGQFADRKGVTFSAIRQLGNGSMVGSGFTWTRANGNDGSLSEIFDGALAVAYRPADSALAFLSKLELRSDKQVVGTNGTTAATGSTALADNSTARSRRAIGSISMNWSPRQRDGEDYVQRSEIGIFAAVRHNLDNYQGYSLAGTTLIGGIDARIGLGEHFEIGGVATARHSFADGTTSFAIGPQIGVSPTKDVLLVIGYNISGFRDPDFSAARNTDKGMFVSLRMKFDADSLGFLGLRR